MKLSPELIINVLTEVHYPKTGKNIVEMGMLNDDIRIEGNKVSFSLLFKKTNCSFVESIIHEAEAVILSRINQKIEIKGNILAVFREDVLSNSSGLLPKIKTFLAVASGKGGVGKSTVSVNLAIALNRLGYKVGLLDADIYGPSIPKMFDEEYAQPIVEIIQEREYVLPLVKYGVKILSIGLFIKRENALAWRGAMASNALKQLITEVYWGELDYFIVDLPPGTGDIALTLIQTVPLTGVILVTTPQKISLLGVRRTVHLFQNQKINVPIIGLIENMSYFSPDELPQNKYYLFGKQGGKQLADRLNIPFLGEIPIIQSICESGDKGIPITLNSSFCIFLYIAKKIALKMGEENETMEFID